MGKNAKKSVMVSDGTYDKDHQQVARLTLHPEIRKGNCLNIGCGFTKFLGSNWTNVDKFPNCNPDMVVDLDVFPYPWPDNTFDYIYANHVFEHLTDWWAAFKECARILKPEGYLEMRVPDESSSSAMTYRDHKHIFYILSFHGIGRPGSKTLFRGGTNAWARTVEGSVPLELRYYHQVPFKQYTWMRHWPFIYYLRFASAHLRNYIWEQQFIFQKYDPDREEENGQE
jgi:SAM-dependent methyltransferase